MIYKFFTYSWNHFHCDVNEEVIRETADAMVYSGLAKLGYKYIVC